MLGNISPTAAQLRAFLHDMQHWSHDALMMKSKHCTHCHQRSSEQEESSQENLFQLYFAEDVKYVFGAARVAELEE